MKIESASVQIALVGGAVFAGVLLDRLVQAAAATSSLRERRMTILDDSVVRPTSAVSATSPLLTPVVAESEAKVAVSSPAHAKLSLDAILAQRDQRQRLGDLQAFINAISPGEYGDALKRIRQMTNSNERELASRLLVAQWVQSDPDGALQFAAGNRGFEYVAEDVFQQLATGDFESALNRAKAIPGNDLRYRALRGVLSFKADTDPRGAIQLAQTFGEFRGNEPLASAIYRQWAANDPQGAALQAAGEAQGEGWSSPVSSVVQTWAQQDPVAAAKWSLGLADAEAQARSIAQVMRQWTREDPQAAANWIHSLEQGASRDAAVAGFAQSLVNQDAQTALSWIGSIADDSTRARTLQRVSGTVMWRDPQNGAQLDRLNRRRFYARPHVAKGKRHGHVARSAKRRGLVASRRSSRKSD